MEKSEKYDCGSVDTAKVKGRRTVILSDHDDIIKEAERLMKSQVQMIGNWTLGQVFLHLSNAINGSIDGFSFKLTWIEILFVRLVHKSRVIHDKIIPGIGRNPRWKSVMPVMISDQDGFRSLENALKRYRENKKRCPHPAMGHLTEIEWDSFHLRHAELHFSFAVLK